MHAVIHMQLPVSSVTASRRVAAAFRRRLQGSVGGAVAATRVHRQRASKHTQAKASVHNQAMAATIHKQPGMTASQPATDSQLQSANDLDPKVDQLLRRVKAFVHARSMQDHWQAYTVFDNQVGWDVPPILLEGREKLRVVAYFGKRVANLDFIPHSVEVKHTRQGDREMSMFCTFLVRLLPERLPLPTIKLKATVNLGVVGDFEQVNLIHGRIHNIPCLPDFLRRLNAFVLGTLGLATEGAWSKTVWVYGDRSYQQKRAKN